METLSFCNRFLLTFIKDRKSFGQICYGENEGLERTEMQTGLQTNFHEINAIVKTFERPMILYIFSLCSNQFSVKNVENT